MNTQVAQAAIASAEADINASVAKLQEFLGPNYELRVEEKFIFWPIEGPSRPSYRVVATLGSEA